jgi:hypothetical protein
VAVSPVPRVAVSLPVPPAGPARVSERPLARVTVGRDGMTAQCPPCRVHLEQRPGTDTREALRAFLAAHPVARHERHCADIPAGWLPRLVGALSQ